jgi:3-oxoacyl-[acyl-carrier protein] reductase
MDLGLSGKVALVAGSSRGIGLAIARRFLAEGASAMVTGRDAAALERAADALRSEFSAERVGAHEGDLGDGKVSSALIEATEDQLGPIDCLVLSAGTGRGPAGVQPGEAAWQEGLRANLETSVRVTEAALPGMIERGQGSIVFIASIAGLEAAGGPLPYSTAKAALISYSGRLARELAGKGVRVNCVAPGNVLFEGGSWEEKVSAEPERWQAYVEAEVPAGRFASPDEIAEPVVFLCSERASFIVGACLVADGGQTQGLL